MRNSFFIAIMLVVCVVLMIGGLGSFPVQSKMLVSGKPIDEGMAFSEAMGMKPVLVKEEPICSPNKRPHIETVEPDEVKPGDKMIVTGRYFGEKKECLYKVTIGSEEAKDPTYINEQKVEVTVPDSARPGMTFLNIQSGGGAARSAILVQRNK